MPLGVQVTPLMLLGLGIGLLLIGYFLGEIVQSIEDGLLLLSIRLGGYLLVVYFALKIFFGIDPL